MLCGCRRGQCGEVGDLEGCVRLSMGERHSGLVSASKGELHRMHVPYPHVGTEAHGSKRDVGSDHRGFGKSSCVRCA